MKTWHIVLKININSGELMIIATTNSAVPTDTKKSFVPRTVISSNANPQTAKRKEKRPVTAAVLPKRPAVQTAIAARAINVHLTAVSKCLVPNKDLKTATDLALLKPPVVIATPVTDIDAKTAVVLILPMPAVEIAEKLFPTVGIFSN